MTVKFEVRTSDSPARTVFGTLDNDEMTCLEQFLRHVKALESTGIVKSRQFGKLNIKGNSRSTTFNVELPSDDLVAALLHRMRRFVLHREPTSYNSIAGIIGKKFSDPLIRLALKELRAIFEAKSSQKLFRVTIDNRIVNSQDVLELWLNAAGEYHESFDEKRELESFHAVLPEAPMRFFMLEVLSEKVRAILGLGGLVAMILNKQATWEATFN